jgi:four helix bundle protein
MNTAELKERFKKLAIRIVKMVDKLPNIISGRAIGNQVIRSETSPGANYNAACIAKFNKDFISKLKMVKEELDETIYWLTLIADTELIKPELLLELHKETKRRNLSNQE